MFSFNDVVSNILLEKDPVQVQGQNAFKLFTKVLEAHDKLDFSNNKFTNNDSNLNKIYALVAGKNYVADKDVKTNLSDTRVIDILQRLYNATKNKVSTWNEFKDLLNNSRSENNIQYINILNEYAKITQSLTPENKESWVPLDAEVRRAYESSMVEIASLGEKALESDPELNNSSVIDAVQEIVNRRIGVFTRIAKLKNPKQPFTNLINDIFKTPELYLSGSKKYTSDFSAINDLYIQDLIKVAIAAKEFYAAEITRLKTSEKTKNNQQQTQNVNASLNLFDNLLNNVLYEVNSTDWATSALRSTEQDINTQQQSSSGKNFSPAILKQLNDKALQDVRNRINFLSGIPIQYTLVDQTGKETGQTEVVDSNKEYNIGQILKNKSPEAQKLIQALSAIALYTKKRLGAGEAASRGIRAIGALSTALGPVN